MSIYEAIDKFRESAIQVDLSPDGQYMVKGKVIHYVTIGKFKRALSPLFNKAGLDFSFNIVEVTDLPTVTRVKVEFILTDVKTGQADSRTIYADGPNIQAEKGIEIAMSYAMRIYFSNRFMLVDGIEFDNYGETVEDILDNVAIPETEKPKAPRINVTEYVKKKEITIPQATVKEEPQTVETKDEPTGKVVESSTPKGHKSVVKPKTGLISEMEMRAATNTMDIIEKAYADGKILEESYNQAKTIFENLSNAQDVGVLLEIKNTINKEVKEGF